MISTEFFYGNPFQTGIRTKRVFDLNDEFSFRIYRNSCRRTVFVKIAGCCTTAVRQGPLFAKYGSATAISVNTKRKLAISIKNSN